MIFEIPELDELIARLNVMESKFKVLQEAVNAKNRPENEFLTVQETADILRVHYNTAYRKVVAGELKAIRSLRHYRIERKDLDEFIKNSKGKY